MSKQLVLGRMGMEIGVLVLLVPLLDLVLMRLLVLVL